MICENCMCKLVITGDGEDAVYMCLRCNEEYPLNYFSSSPEETERSVVDAIITQEALEFGVCKVCGKKEVLPNEWFAICPNCIFKQDYL